MARLRDYDLVGVSPPIVVDEKVVCGLLGPGLLLQPRLDLPQGLLVLLDGLLRKGQIQLAIVSLT